MRTMLTIAFSIFAMTACAVEPDEPESPRDELSEIEKPVQPGAEEQPIHCETNLDCHGYSVHLACDLVSSTCVKIDLEEQKREEL